MAFTSGSDAFFTNSAAVTIVSSGITAYDVAANAAGRVSFSGGSLSANSLTLQGKGSLVINNSLLTSNSVAVTTNGTLSLLNSNSIGAGVNISGGGRVIIGSNFSLGQGTLSVSNGILSPNAKASDILNSIVVTGGNATLSNAAAATLSGDISGMGAFTKAGAGSLSLTGSDSYAGGTTVLAGILAGTTASLEGMNSNNATIVFNQSGSGTFTGSISGKGKLIDAGLGSVTMTGTNTYGGGTIVTLGNLAAGSLGRGSLTLKPSKGNVSSFSDTLTSGVLDVKALTLDGSSTIDLETPYTSIRSTSAAVTILGTNNFIDLSGAWTNMGTYPLLTGTKIAGSGLKDLSLTGSFLGGATLLLGQSTNYDGYTYAFTDIINSIDLKISGMTPSVDPLFENLQIIGNDPELGGRSTEVSTVQAVLEPSTYPLLALGLLTLIIAVRRRKLSKPLFLS